LRGEVAPVRSDGPERSDPAGISSDKPGENPGRRNSQVS
jgi:hypothetical protein